MYKLNIVLLKKNIRTLRVQHELTVTQLANKLNMSKESIYRWEDPDDKEQRNPSLESIVSLCNLFNLTIEELLFNEVSPQNSPSLLEDEFDKLTLGLISQFPYSMQQYFFDLYYQLNKSIKKIDKIQIGAITHAVTGRYIAFKIKRHDNSLNKVIHFMTIFPNLKQQVFRFIFSTSSNELNNTNLKFSQSPMGATINVDASNKPEIDYIVDVCRQVISLVIKSKTGN